VRLSSLHILMVVRAPKVLLSLPVLLALLWISSEVKYPSDKTREILSRLQNGATLNVLRIDPQILMEAQAALTKSSCLPVLRNQTLNLTAPYALAHCIHMAASCMRQCQMPVSVFVC